MLAAVLLEQVIWIFYFLVGKLEIKGHLGLSKHITKRFKSMFFFLNIMFSIFKMNFFFLLSTYFSFFFEK